MTLRIDTPNVGAGPVVYPGVIGPGYDLIIVQDALGPFPLDDYFQINVNWNSPDAMTVGIGRKVLAGFTHRFVTIGLGGGLGPTNGGLLTNVPAGSAVSLDIFQVHASGGLADSLTVPGWTWDPIGGLYVLAQTAANGLSGGGSTLDQILAAVTRTYTNA